ncbi:tyrosine-type recombinase/integrase [Limosilactobacillus reuteri]|uniref:tyrosine-type recombinase/integrase n=1 Tax=Limosilactobacillus reuteri TaxID=1598 RepID=UPI002F2677A8
MAKKHIQTSEPLRSMKQINLVRSLIETSTDYPLRNRLLFDIGINNGIRTIDLLSLKVSDVVDTKGNPKSETTIIESKTGKPRTVRFNTDIQAEVKNYLDKRPFKSDWLFPSTKQRNKHLTTQAVYRMFKRISDGEPSLKGLTAHSMRRTFGYHFYKRTHDIVPLMKLFNHSSQAITLRYIGIEKEDMDKELAGFKL